MRNEVLSPEFCLPPFCTGVFGEVFFCTFPCVSSLFLTVFATVGATALKGLAMKSFVDKVKAGNWGKTLLAVANLGAAATSVGVSVGVAAAQPLAKDLARGFEDLTVKGVQPPSSNEVRCGG